MTRWLKGDDLVAVPMVPYAAEFARDPVDSLIKYGCLPQRARSPWYTDAHKLQDACQLPSLVTGPQAVLRRAPHSDEEWMAAEAHPIDDRLIAALARDVRTSRDDWMTAPWHIHVDPGLNRGRKGDAAAVAVGRIIDMAQVPAGTEWRTVLRYVIPIVMQVVAPMQGEIHLTAISRFILQLRGILGINITSFSYDGFQSAGAIQELTQAGLVTAGVRADEFGRLFGFGKPFSVDRTPDAHQELKESVNEGRVLMPDYYPLKKELSHLEYIPGKAPDHPTGSGASKDCADAAAGVVGYLSVYGHERMTNPMSTTVSTEDIYKARKIASEQTYDIERGPTEFAID